MRPWQAWNTRNGTILDPIPTEIQVVIGIDALLGSDDSPATVAIGARQPEPIGAAQGISVRQPASSSVSATLRPVRPGSRWGCPL